MFITLLAFLLLRQLSLAFALRVTTGSPCSNVCQISNPMSGEDVVCNDDDFTAPKGKSFKDCLNCLQESPFGTENDNDQIAFIRNLKFATTWCLFDSNNAGRINGPCDDEATCTRGFKSSLRSEDAGTGSPFDFCAINGTTLDSQAMICNDCVSHMEGNRYLSNWIVAIQAGCSQRPNQNTLLGLSGSVFSSNPVTIQQPISADQARKNNTKDESITTGEIAGIAVSVAAVVAIVAALIAIKLCRRRRQRKLGVTEEVTDNGDVTGGAALEGDYATYKPEPAVETMAVTEESFKLEELRCESSLSGKSRNTNDSSDQSPPKATIEAASSPNVPNTGSEPARTSSLKQLETTPSRASTSQSDSNSKRDGDQSPAMNPLRMNSFVRATQSPIELAATPLQPYPTKRQPSTNPYIPSPVTPFSALSQVSPVFAPSVNNTYNERLHVQPSPKPGYASSIASSTSTVFSPDVYTTPPPYLQTSRPSSTSNYRPQYPVVPLPTYNPAAYVSQTHQQRINLPNYSQKQPPPQKQQRFQERQRLPTDQYQNAHSELPLRYTPYPYAASSPHRPPKSHVSTPKEVQATHRSTSSQSSVSKMATNIVPTISLPIPAPKRTTMDMRSLVGMGLNTHVKPEQDLEANRLPEKGSKGEAGIPSSPKRFSFELPPGLDRTDSLIRRSSSPFRERARNSSLKRMTTRPQQNEENQQLIQKTKTETKRREREERYTVKRSSSLVRSVSRSSFRGRSTSRPRRDGMGAESPDRDRKRSESRRRLMAENNSKAGFSFGFKGQDSV